MTNTNPGFQWKEDDVERLIGYYLRQWRSNTDFDDLCQEARLELFMQWCRTGQTYPLAHLARLVLPKVPNHWLRSRRCGDIMFGGVVQFKVVPLSGLLTEDDEEEKLDQLFINERTGVTSDLRALYQEFIFSLSQRDRRLAEAILVDGHTVKQAGAMVGLQFTGARDRWMRLTDKYRVQYGLPRRHPKDRQRDEKRARASQSN